MKPTIIIVFGVLLLIAGVAGSLLSSVALATADTLEGVRAPEGMELRMSPDDPRVKQQEEQATTVLFGSLLCGVCGLLAVGSGWWMKKNSRPEPPPPLDTPVRPEETQESAAQPEHPAAADRPAEQSESVGESRPPVTPTGEEETGETSPQPVAEDLASERRESPNEPS